MSKIFRKIAFISDYFSSSEDIEKVEKLFKNTNERRTEEENEDGKGVEKVEILFKYTSVQGFLLQK